MHKKKKKASLLLFAYIVFHTIPYIECLINMHLPTSTLWWREPLHYSLRTSRSWCKPPRGRRSRKGPLADVWPGRTLIYIPHSELGLIRKIPTHHAHMQGHQLVKGLQKSKHTIAHCHGNNAKMFKKIRLSLGDWNLLVK
jgi:hypothetical protein